MPYITDEEYQEHEDLKLVWESNRDTYSYPSCGNRPIHTEFIYAQDLNEGETRCFHSKGNVVNHKLFVIDDNYMDTTTYDIHITPDKD